MVLDTGRGEVKLTELEIQREKPKQSSAGASRQIQNALGLGISSGEVIYLWWRVCVREVGDGQS